MRAVAGLPGFPAGLAAAKTATADEIYAALVLAREIRDRGIVDLHAHFGSSPASVALLAACAAAGPRVLPSV
jgi:hypothetical protein